MTQHPDKAGMTAVFEKAYVEHLPIEELRPVLAALLQHLELQLYKSDGFYSDDEYSFKPIGASTP